ncbi:MAG: S8 family peptidase, partial [Clostridiales bacterium]
MIIATRKIVFSVAIMFFSFSILLFAQGETVIKNGKKLYLSNTVIVKQKGAPAGGSLNKSSGVSSSLMQKLSSYGVKNITQTFKSSDNALGDIVTIKYNTSKDPLTVASELEKSGEVLWAEPHYISKMHIVPENAPLDKTPLDKTLFPAPNDPSYSSQWWLTNIKALEGWDISSGDTNVVIGIVDCGVEWKHADLNPNIWINRKEIPGNGIDDDHNGYIDDVQGWDLGGLNGTPDNDPTEDDPQHGTHVAGIAAAVSNNGIGIASIGYKCKIMAVKASRNDQRDPQTGGAYIWYGYEGIVYAANNGAKVINCSWGGSSYSRLEQEVVNYALSKGALIVASAGNDKTDEYAYPAAYDGVLSVAATDKDDKLTWFSNFGSYIGVCAPGLSILSTWQPGTYWELSGTSMSSPLVSGLAALVRSKFPDYNPRQVAEQIRVNCDNIDAVNPGFEYQLGGGRVNAYKALTNTNSKSVRAYDIIFSDEAPGGNGNNIFEAGETITVSVKFRNYLSNISNLNISLESNNKFVKIINGSFNAGSFARLDSFNNYSSKFTFSIAKDVPEDTSASFLIKFTDNSTYSDFQWTKRVLLSPSYGNMKAGSVTLTVTGRGSLGFKDFPNNFQGEGFHYKDGPNLLFEGALMYGNSLYKVANTARFQDVSDSSFKSIEPFVVQVPGTIADYQGTALFNDSRNSADSYSIETKLSSYSYADVPNDKFIILKYSLTNKSGSNISNLYTGLFLDWDINADTSDADIANYDATDNFGYAYSNLGRPKVYAGCALISSEKYGYYAISNDGSDGGIGIYYLPSQRMDGFTK